MDGKGRLADICAKTPALRGLYGSRVRHYQIWEHTLNVFNQFEKYFSNDFDKHIIEDFRLFLLLHDIGKSIAYKQGNRDNQYNETIRIIRKYKTELNISDDNFGLFEALIRASNIGRYMEGKISMDDIFALIEAQCKISTFPLAQFFYLLLVYYQCDVASYTKDAGGLSYLEHLFEYEDGHKVYSVENKLLKHREDYQQRYTLLQNKIHESKKITNLFKETNKTCETFPKIGVKIVGKIDLSKFEKPRKELKKDKQNLYIIDTNVFVDYPEIISKINKKYPVILSAKVLDELDNLKSTLDNVGKTKVQKALKSINRNIDNRDLKMELADLSLLPLDFNKRSPDNMILTVALKFKAENPIILTSDNGLQIKAKGLGLSTISLKEFLKR